MPPECDFGKAINDASMAISPSLCGGKRAPSSLRRRRSKIERILIRISTCCSKPVPLYASRRNRPEKISWDEHCIEKHMDERGVLYGTMQIEDAPTPFLLYDSNMSRADGAVVEVGENHSKQQVNITELQLRLGVMKQEQESGKELDLKFKTRQLEV